MSSFNIGKTYLQLSEVESRQNLCNCFHVALVFSSFGLELLGDTYRHRRESILNTNLILRFDIGDNRKANTPTYLIRLSSYDVKLVEVPAPRRPLMAGGGRERRVLPWNLFQIGSPSLMASQPRAVEPACFHTFSYLSFYLSLYLSF